MVISTHAPRTGSDDRADAGERPRKRFQPTLPARGATVSRIASSAFSRISTHAPRTGSDMHAQYLKYVRTEFQSTLPARGATEFASGKSVTAKSFQSTLPARGATREHDDHLRDLTFQSTLPARGATTKKQAEKANGWISIHAPRTGSDQTQRRGRQSGKHFNPRSPHGERHALANPQCGGENISIHAPRTGSDVIDALTAQRIEAFQSTLPARGATECTCAQCGAKFEFQSTLPARGATSKPCKGASPAPFQSTLPARGAT